MVENIAQQYGVADREVIFPGSYKLRHIAPKAAAENLPGIVNPLGEGVSVLSQTLYAKPLPVSHEPTSPDFHEGTDIVRLNDAGEWSLSFPNRDASDGQPWRSRFDNEGHREFIEIYHEGQVEFIGLIVKIVKERGKITISGYDGAFLLKKAYEKEWRGVMAPRDLIERYTGVWRVGFYDNFSSQENFNTHYTTGGIANHGGYGWTVAANELTLEVVKTIEPGGAYARLSTPLPLTQEGAIAPFRAQVIVPRFDSGETNLHITSKPTEEAVLAAVGMSAGGGEATFTGNIGEQRVRLTEATGEITLELEYDGRWMRGWVAGTLVGYFQPNLSAGTDYYLGVEGIGGPLPGKWNFAWRELTCRVLVPFLLRGTEKGEYVLPGDAATYPYGGLHADYYVYGGEGASKWYEVALAPDPRRAEPTVHQEPEINHTGTEWTPPVAGVPAEYFAVRWYGAVYLDLENNSLVQFSLSNLDDGARLWVGKTRFGDQIIDEWNLGSSRTVFGDVTAASLGAKRGWFPIILEYFNGPSYRGIELNFRPPENSWTDPGGIVITAGESSMIVPPTSLSPLGCFNEPIQGQSHFDIIENITKQFGYQFALEPKQLESGEFPGQIIPKARVGQDYDEKLEVDDIDRKSGINNYAYSLDATDSATSIQALGSGIADGKGSQVSFETVAIEAAAEALFDIQAFVSEGSVAEPALLAALAEAQLALRLGAWDNLSGEPIAKDRLADTFPLTGKLSLLKWKAGDGIRVWLPDVGVEDLTPRAIMQATRNFSPDGRTSAQIGFRSRPKDALYGIRQLLRSVVLPQRTSQRAYEDVPGTFIQVIPAPPKTITDASIVSLHPQDKVVDARVRISLNDSGFPVRLWINGTDRTSELGGPWSVAPVEVPVTQFATMAGAHGGRVYAQVENENATTANVEIDFQLILTVLRA